MSVETLCHLFRQSVLERPRPDAARLVPAQGPLPAPLSSAQVASAVECLYHFWRASGAGRGERVLLWMPNRPEWAIADFSILAAGMAVVPIYLTLGREEVRQMLAISRPRFAVVGDERIHARLREAAGSNLLPEVVVVFGGAEAGATAWEGALARGEERRRESGAAEFLDSLERVRPQEPATIIFTSGTTGAPKGVVLTHANIVSNVHACLKLIGFGAADVALSFLPLCHIYERMIDYCYWLSGAALVYVADPRTVAEALPRVAPTALGAVPRFYEKLARGIQERLQALPPWRRRLAEWAVSVGRRWTERAQSGRPVPPSLAVQRALSRWLVLRKIHRAFGGRLRILISGGAPLARETADYLWALDLRVLQGYGLTETSPVLALSPPQRCKNGTVGPALPGTVLRIAADGEILARGPGIMQGYYNDPEATRAVLVDGWFATGDIGRLDEDGYLSITGRKKEMIVTAGGKKVIPSMLERRLESDPLIAQAALIGDRRPFVSALIVPDFAVLEREAASRGVFHQNRQDLTSHPEVRRLYETRIAALLSDLAPYEQVRRFTLLNQEWTPESGEITPTLKIRRRVVEERYHDPIERMYAAAPSGAAAGREG
jgi:long-chain acyl-CoA synthetase